MDTQSKLSTPLLAYEETWQLFRSLLMHSVSAKGQCLLISFIHAMATMCRNHLGLVPLFCSAKIDANVRNLQHLMDWRTLIDRSYRRSSASLTKLIPMSRKIIGDCSSSQVNRFLQNYSRRQAPSRRSILHSSAERQMDSTWTLHRLTNNLSADFSSSSMTQPWKAVPPAALSTTRMTARYDQTFTVYRPRLMQYLMDPPICSACETKQQCPVGTFSANILPKAPLPFIMMGTFWNLKTDRRIPCLGTNVARRKSVLNPRSAYPSFVQLRYPWR